MNGRAEESGIGVLQTILLAWMYSRRVTCTMIQRKGRSLSSLISSVGVRMMPVSHGRVKNLGFVVQRSISLRLSRSVHPVRTMDCASLHRPARRLEFLSSLPSPNCAWSLGAAQIQCSRLDPGSTDRRCLDRVANFLQIRFCRSENQSAQEQLERKNETIGGVGGSWKEK